MNKFAVIGLGRFGTSVAKKLSEQGAEVLAIDRDPHSVDSLRDDVAYAVAMDATDVKALQAQNIEDMDAVIVAIGEDFESTLLVSVNLIDLKMKRIITRAMSKTQANILRKIGLKEVINPETEVGLMVAQKLLNPSMVSFLKLPGEYEIVEINTPANVVNRTLQDIDLRKKYNLNLVTIKRQETSAGAGAEPSIIGVPGPETVLQQSDTMILMGKERDVKRFIDINK